jgi:hypothetical protein
VKGGTLNGIKRVSDLLIKFLQGVIGLRYRAGNYIDFELSDTSAAYMLVVEVSQVMLSS